MIDTTWFTVSPATLVSMSLSVMGIYIALLLLTRLAGLRSFSKMSSFDFAITVAFGSILATTILSPSPALGAGVLALALLFAIQYLVARSRRLSVRVQRLVDNEPIVLMAGERVLTENLSTARVTRGDLYSKLRMAGITHRCQVLAVVFETTGDFSVLTREQHVEAALFEHVRDGHLIPAGEATDVRQG